MTESVLPPLEPVGALAKINDSSRKVTKKAY